MAEGRNGRIIFHVDMDAFYAAVEEQQDPRLKGRPVVVGADPKFGRGRGVVSTANYGARRFGIHSAMPIAQAYRLCPHATFLRPDFKKYRAASRTVMERLASYADTMEEMGLDEAYLDVGGDFQRARSLALSLRAAILRETGLTCSIGVAHCKAVAKIASDHRKPRGITVVHPEDAAAFLEPLPVRALNGCGPKTAAALKEMDIHTVGELAAAPRTTLEDRFGSHGAWLHRVASGRDERPVKGSRGPAKSRGNERTFPRDVKNPALVQAKVSELVEEDLQMLHRQNVAFSTLTLKLRYSDYTTRTRSQSFPIPMEPGNHASREHAIATARQMLGPLLDNRPVRLVGIRFSGLGPSRGQQDLQSFAPAVTA